MALTDEQVFKISQGGDETTTALILTIDAMSDRIAKLSARIEKLEEPAAKTLRLVQDG